MRRNKANAGLGCAGSAARRDGEAAAISSGTLFQRNYLSGAASLRRFYFGK